MNWPAGLDGWQLLAGLGLFLLGMDQLEQALHALAGRTFNLMLRRVTGHPFKSVLFGFVATGLLQSSSILGLVVLAFVGAGVLPMRNALGVILGSNIGSTLTGWIVASVGFRLNLELLALPLAGIGAITVVFTLVGTRRHAWGAAALALGLLLLGIGYMTTAASAFAQGIDPARLAHYGPLVFFLVGLGVTVVVRTSAATILMALSAMNAGILDLQQAAAIAIGADLGTTSTMVIAAVTGVAAKKQVALFHVLFNTVSDVLALFFLLPYVATITRWYGIDDPLLALPAFHTTFNVLGVLLFYPLTGRIADWLSHRFRDGLHNVAVFLPRVSTDAREPALAALENEVRALYRRVLALNIGALRLSLPATLLAPDGNAPRGNGHGNGGGYAAQYAAAKQLEGEILAYVRLVQAQPLTDSEAHRLAALLVAAREAVQAAKAVKDVYDELQDFRRTANERLAALIDDYDAATAGAYAVIAGLVERPVRDAANETAIAGCENRMVDEHQAFRRRLYAETRAHGLDDIGVSTLFNVMHEIHGSERALLRGCRALLLDEVS